MSSPTNNSPCSNIAPYVAIVHPDVMDDFETAVRDNLMAIHTYAAKAEEFRRSTVRAAHPDWSDDQIEAHLILHEPPTVKFRRHEPLIGGTLKIYTGAAPLNPTDPPQGKLLATFQNADWMNWTLAPAPSPATPSRPRRWLDSLRSFWRR